jgi:hypothetical protein
VNAANLWRAASTDPANGRRVSRCAPREQRRFGVVQEIAPFFIRGWVSHFAQEIRAKELRSQFEPL